MTLDFPASPTDGQLHPEPPNTPLWEFIADPDNPLRSKWKRLGGGGGGGGSLELPSKEEAEDGTTTTARAWSSLRDRQALEAWYLTQAPEIFIDFYSPPIKRDLITYLEYVEGLQRNWGATNPANFASISDRRFGGTLQTLGVASNSATIRGDGLSWFIGGVQTFGTNRGRYTLTINSTAAFSLQVENTLGNSTTNWEAEILITTTQVPASFSFAGTDTVIVVPGSALTDNPFAAGGVTSLYLAKRNATSLTAQFSPATVDP